MEEFDIKKAGLNVGEDIIKMVIKNVVMPYAEHYVKNSETKVDDIILPFLGQLEKALVDLADKIDGEKDIL